MAAGVGARPPAYNPEAGPVMVKGDTPLPEGMIRLWPGVKTPARLEFDKIEAVAYTITGVTRKYFYTDFQIGSIDFNGRTLRAMIAREIDAKLLQEENINQWYRQGKILSIQDNVVGWAVSDELHKKLNLAGCGQIAIVRTISVVKNGQVVTKHQAFLRKEDAFKRGTANCEFDRSMLLTMASKHVPSDRTDYKDAKNQTVKQPVFAMVKKH